MQNHLNPRPLIIAERFKFYQRSQAENKFVAQYLAKLCKSSDTYAGESINVLGEAIVTVVYGEQKTMQVTCTRKWSALLGRNWLKSIRLN